MTGSTTPIGITVPAEVSRTRRQRGPWPAIAAVLGLGVVMVALALQAYQRANIPGQPDETNLWLSDFRDAIYYPVVAFLQGGNPYDVAAYLRTYPVGYAFPLYSPATLAVYLPLGVLPYRMAERVYFALTIVLTLVLAVLVQRFSGRRATLAPTCIIAMLILISRPGYWNLLLGQCAVQMVIGCVLALQYGQTRPWLAGGGLALATLKPTFGVPLAVLMAARGDWRAVGMGGVLATVSALVVLLVIGANNGGLASVAAAIPDNYRNLNAEISVFPPTSATRADAVALVGRWYGQALPLAVELMIAVAVISLGVFGMRAARRRRGQDAVAVTIVCVVTLLATYHQNTDLVLLAIPLVLLVRGRAGARPDRALLITLLALPAANHLIGGRLLGALVVGGPLWLTLASLNGAALAAALLLAVRKIHVESPET